MVNYPEEPRQKGIYPIGLSYLVQESIDAGEYNAFSEVIIISSQIFNPWVT